MIISVNTNIHPVACQWASLMGTWRDRPNDNKEIDPKLYVAVQMMQKVCLLSSGFSCRREAMSRKDERRAWHSQ